MTKAGFLLGIVGSGIMLGSNIVFFVINSMFYTLGASGSTLPFIEVIPFSQMITIVLAILGIVFSMKAKGGLKTGYIAILIIGLIAAIGVFIPLVPPRILDMGDGSTYPAPAITLAFSIIYIDSFFLINGGLIGLLTVKFVSTEEREALKIEKEAIKKERRAIRKQRDKVKNEKKVVKKKKKDEGIVEAEKEIEELEVIKREREALKREREALEKEREELDKVKDGDTKD